MGFEPFQKVLTRENADDYWFIDFFGEYGSGDARFVTMRYPFGCQYCISYEDNKHYLGTNKAED